MSVLTGPWLEWVSRRGGVWCWLGRGGRRWGWRPRGTGSRPASRTRSRTARAGTPSPREGPAHWKMSQEMITSFRISNQLSINFKKHLNIWFDCCIQGTASSWHRCYVIYCFVLQGLSFSVTTLGQGKDNLVYYFPFLSNSSLWTRTRTKRL